MSKINRKVAVVGGAGHIGLPLSMLFAKHRFEVISIDNDEKKISNVKKGISPFDEPGLEILLKKQKKLKIVFSTDFSLIKKCDIIFVTLGTPIDEYLNPNFKFFLDNLKPLFKYLHNKQTLILRSTVYPGATKKIYKILKKNKISVNLAFCPERIAQGLFFKEIYKFPQIVSGVDQKSLKVSKKIFKTIGIKTIECSVDEAEIAKLMCNSWRYLKFGIANQFYTICEDNNLNYNKIRSIMNFDYDRAKDIPKSGFAAGPCLLKDTMQLSSFSRRLFSMGHDAMLANETLPDFLVYNLKKKKNLNNKTVGILGMTFKPDNDDIRDSLAYRLKKKLEEEGCKVLCSDPFFKDKNFVSMNIILKKSKIIFIGCPHSEYKNIKFPKNIQIIDCWGFVSK